MEKYADPLLVEVQANGFKGPQLPTDYTTFFPGFKFVLISTEKCRLYQVIPTETVNDEFDACIKIRSGKYKWIEINYEISSNKHYYGETLLPSETNRVSETKIPDVYDAANRFYELFDHNSETTQTIVTKLLEDKCTSDDLKNYLNMTLEDNIISNLKACIKNILYYKYIYSLSKS